MNFPQATKTGIAVWATAATDATSSSSIDRLGFDYATIDVIMPVATATNSSAKWGALTISHGDTTYVSSATAITALTGTTATSTTAGFCIAANNTTSLPQITRLFVDCRGKGRYLFVTKQCAASHQTAYVRYELSRANQGPDSDTERGVAVSAYG